MVCYEDLGNAPSDKLRELFAFSGPAWGKQIERFLAYRRLRDSERYFELRRTIDSIDPWQAVLPNAERTNERESINSLARHPQSDFMQILLVLLSGQLDVTATLLECSSHA